MHLIAYTSGISPKVTNISEAIDDIVRVAQESNKNNGITGVLFFHNGKFLQIIEGNQYKLRKLMKSIESDPRHHNVKTLINCNVEKRGFSDWAMDSFDLNQGSKIDNKILFRLTEKFKENIMPRSDFLAVYYKALLAKQAA